MCTFKKPRCEKRLSKIALSFTSSESKSIHSWYIHGNQLLQKVNLWQGKKSHFVKVSTTGFRRKDLELRVIAVIKWRKRGNPIIRNTR